MSQVDSQAKPMGAIAALEKLRDLEATISAAFKAEEEDTADALLSDAERLYDGFPGGRPRILDLARERLEQIGVAG